MASSPGQMHKCIELPSGFDSAEYKQIGESKKVGMDSSGHRLSLESPSKQCWKNFVCPR